LFRRVTNAEVIGQTEQEDLTFADSMRWSLAMSVDYLRRRQFGWLCDWQSTREVEAVPTTIHIGSDDQDDRDTPGYKWSSTLVPQLMLHGTLPSTAAVGGRYDPSWSSMTDDDDDDDDVNALKINALTALLFISTDFCKTAIRECEHLSFSKILKIIFLLIISCCFCHNCQRKTCIL